MKILIWISAVIIFFGLFFPATKVYGEPEEPNITFNEDSEGNITANAVSMCNDCNITPGYTDESGNSQITTNTVGGSNEGSESGNSGESSGEYNSQNTENGGVLWEDLINEGWIACEGQTIITSNIIAGNLQLTITGNLSNVSFGDGYNNTTEGIQKWMDDYLNGNAQLPTCNSSGSSGSKEIIESICWNNLVITPGRIVCGGDYSVTASASVPCPGVIREPYPRAVVGEPITFQIGSNGISQGSGTRKDCDVTQRNYTIEIEWVQLPILPRWDFKDYRWSNDPRFALGWTVQHTFETASFGLNENGPSTNGIPNLPSYQVSVETFWQPRLREQWEQWRDHEFYCEKYLNDGNSTGYAACQSDESYCNSLGAFGRIDDDRCGDWRQRGSGWITIDLRWFGFPTPYTIRTTAKDVTPMPPNLPPLNPPIEGCILPVPVIESQSLLSGN